MAELTADQRNTILSLSREAQAFILSPLYQEIERWVKTEQALTTQAIVLDQRNKSEKELTREQFVERKCSYFLALPTILAVFKQYASQEAQLKKIDEHAENKSSGNNSTS